MLCYKIKTSEIGNEQKQIPLQKHMKRIHKEYTYDNDNLFIIINEKKHIIHNINHYKFAVLYGLEFINCVQLEKGEYFDGVTKTIKTNKKKLTPKEPIIPTKKSVTEKVAKRDNYICYICGQKTQIRGKRNDVYLDTATVDHVVARANGGRNAQSNLKCCCKYCNNIKAARPLTNDLKELIASQRQFLEKKNIVKFSDFKANSENKKIKKSFSHQLSLYDAWCEI